VFHGTGSIEPGPNDGIVFTTGFEGNMRLEVTDFVGGKISGLSIRKERFAGLGKICCEYPSHPLA